MPPIGTPLDARAAQSHTNRDRMSGLVAAPRDGTVATIHAQPGDLVDERLELIGFVDPLSPG